MAVRESQVQKWLAGAETPSGNPHLRMNAHPVDVLPDPLSDSDLVSRLADAILADESADDVDLAAIQQSEVESLVNGIVSSPSLPSFGTTTRVS